MRITELWICDLCMQEYEANPGQGTRCEACGAGNAYGHVIVHHILCQGCGCYQPASAECIICAPPTTEQLNLF